MARLETWIASLSAGGSATIFAATSSVRWKLIHGVVACLTTAGGATASVGLYEQGTSATTRLYGIVLATQQADFTINVPGGIGAASGTNSRLVLTNADSGPVYGIFIGESW